MATESQRVGVVARADDAAQPWVRAVPTRLPAARHHTATELQELATAAWRNSMRCIGRLHWKRLEVRDRRDATSADEMHAAIVEHLRDSTNGGRIRPMITIFAPDAADGVGPRIWNEQLIRYAGYEQPDGTVIGDPRLVAFTRVVQELGWEGAGGPFDILPLVIETPDEGPRLYDVPREVVLEVPLMHPEHAWFAELGLRWYALPAVSGMALRAGDVQYGAAPFSGWYMNTEIGARNLADVDRYDLLPLIAERLGLDTRRDRTLWKDRALVELNVAVLASFDAAGVAMSDHHAESHRFIKHIEVEARRGRSVPADWSWIVPPLSGAATPVFHREYPVEDREPCFAWNPTPWRAACGTDSLAANGSQC